MSLESISGWLATTPASLTFQTITWVIPTVQTLHILAIAVVISAILMMDLRVLGLAMSGQPTAAVAHRFLPWVWCTVVVLLISGAILIVAEPGRSLPNSTFQLKMVLLIAVLLVTAVFQQGLRRDPLFWERNAALRLGGRLLAVVSLFLWVGIVFAGRWIAYSMEG
ncbi:DUF6644 family protein [Hydrocarboniphaga sp.]|uniref:DUF6644 family protein n=1 Tax=Hydrocarboniphaga sp. TaxID=2033016 RepID=UPI003D11E2D1